jgi:hypothetical protein
MMSQDPAAVDGEAVTVVNDGENGEDGEEYEPNVYLPLVVVRCLAGTFKNIETNHCDPCHE